jgi:hypothetical protein
MTLRPQSAMGTRRVLGGMRERRTQGAWRIHAQAALVATEDVLSRRPARSEGRSFVLQQPPRSGVLE